MHIPERKAMKRVASSCQCRECHTALLAIGWDGFKPGKFGESDRASDVIVYALTDYRLILRFDVEPAIEDYSL